MKRRNIAMFCFVIGAMSLVSSGRDVDDISTDGLRISKQRFVIDKSDLEEPDINRPYKYPGLHSTDLDEGGVIGSDGIFPFRDGLRRRTESPVQFESTSIFENEDKFGEDGNFRFINGLRKHINTSTTKPEIEDFQRSDEEYPFINGLRGDPRLIKNSISSPKLIDHQSTSDDTGKVSHPVKKRSAGAVLNDTALLEERRNMSSQVGSDSTKHDNVVTNTSSTTDSHPFVNNSVGVDHWWIGPATQYLPTTKPIRAKITFGERKPGDEKVAGNKYRRDFIYRNEITQLVTELDYPTGRNDPNQCPINYIIVQSSQYKGELLDDVIEIASGGIGYPSVKVKVTSTNFGLYGYYLTVYVDCPPELRNKIKKMVLKERPCDVYEYVLRVCRKWRRIIV